MQELVIKVPAPFAGTEELGFSTRYPEQRLDEPLRDVSFFIEGVPELVLRLSTHLEEFPRLSRRAAQGYLWTDPIMISDELLVIAYRDRSMELGDALEVSRRYFANLMQPVVIPFLRDLVAMADLRLSDVIHLSMTRGEDLLADVDFGLAQLIQGNGTKSIAA